MANNDSEKYRLAWIGKQFFLGKMHADTKKGGWRAYVRMHEIRPAGTVFFAQFQGRSRFAGFLMKGRASAQIEHLKEGDFKWTMCPLEARGFQVGKMSTYSKKGSSYQCDNLLEGESKSSF